MDWSYILDIVLKAIGSIGASIIIALAGILFAKLRSKIQDSKISNYIKEAVRAAEQLYPNQGVKMGTEKYKYVVQQVLAKFPNLTDNEYLKSLIEGAVFALNKQLDEKTGSTTTTGSTTINNISSNNSTDNKNNNNTTLSSF